MKATNGTIKLAIEFDGWKTRRSFLHASLRPLWPRGGAGGFSPHLGIACAAHGDAGTLDEYAMGAQLARAGRMTSPPDNPRVDFEHFDWAVHFDASQFAAFLRTVRRGARRAAHRCACRPKCCAMANPSTIRSVRLDSGEMLEAALFIDCSGFHRLLIEKTLQAGFVDWRHWLMCDRAVALPCAHADPSAIAPYTRSRALDAGWTWRIPLQNRVGNGYVYTSDHISDEQALAALRGQLEGEALGDPNFVRFRAGHVRRFWIGNCVAIGLSSGFLEPLESTSISLIQMGIDKLLHLLAGRVDRALGRRRIQPAVDRRVRTHPRFHHPALQRQRPGRTARELWRYCREMPLPETLTRKLDAVSRARAHLEYSIPRVSSSRAGCACTAISASKPDPGIPSPICCRWTSSKMSARRVRDDIVTHRTRRNAAPRVPQAGRRARHVRQRRQSPLPCIRIREQQAGHLD